jgi:hypothetical protein
VRTPPFFMELESRAAESTVHNPRPLKLSLATHNGTIVLMSEGPLPSRRKWAEPCGVGFALLAVIRGSQLEWVAS